MNKADPSTYFAVSVEELQPIAKTFLSKFREGGVFQINGEMGAGKTTFIRAICHELGLHFQGSPTFSLVNEYKTEDSKIVYHFDLYRLKSLSEAMDIGFEEYLDSGFISLIEWPAIVEPLLTEHTYSVDISDHNGIRKIIF